MSETGAAILFVTAFLVGVRETWRMWRRYRDTSPILVEPRAHLVLWAMTVVCLVVTAAAGFFGLLALRRLAEYDPLEWAPVASLIVATAVLFIPLFLGRVASRISDG